MSRITPEYLDHLTEDCGAIAHPIRSASSLSGGCINDAWKVTDSAGNDFFVKFNDAGLVSMFEAEFDALKEMHALYQSTVSIRVPRPVASGVDEVSSYLVLEFVSMSRLGSGHPSWKKMGQQLALLHRNRQPHFGWHRENTIGSTPQPNTPSDDWIQFWREHRMMHQLGLAEQHGAELPEARELLDRLDCLFDDYQPVPSLIHGDLWSGNASFTENGEPFIFDPAAYYGDREAEFGIIDMFGGFPEAFFKGYQSVWPLDQGFSRRLPLYRLYHELNHLNLFGHSYLESVRSSIRQLQRQFS